MLANRLERRVDGERGTKHGRLQTLDYAWNFPKDEDSGNTQTTFSSVSEDEKDQLAHEIGEMIAAIKLVLVVLDVLLVLHRFARLHFDVQSLNKRSAITPAQRAGGEAPKSTKEIETHSCRGEQDQSRRKWRSRDHRRTCRGSETVSLGHCFAVVVVCAGASVLTVLPVKVVGGPMDAGLVMSRLFLPSSPSVILPVTAPADHRGAVDDLRSSAERHRQLIDVELRQIQALRQLHGND